MAEPSVNGLQADSFPEQSFDVVTACHVFEHIPADRKGPFLEQLCTVGRRMVLLLGPMDTGDRGADACPLIYEITGARWAKEHLECGRPPLDLVTSFAAEQGLPCRVSPNGDHTAVYWAVFAEYFAACAGKERELRAIRRFANQSAAAGRGNPADPNEYIIEIDLDRREPRP